ncbi:MAG TPA: aminoacyl-tRNA hydrolase [Candidatus Angelobacter sp.]|nr:aminoacyl-tRNA hydrolase [Candidatus Angelobacter sp.]
MKLIFAQGNPEPDYARSRHNVGFLVLNTLAKEHDTKWTNEPKFHAIITEVNLGDEKAILVKPTSYYNETGVAARKLIDFYKLNPMSDLLVVHDDLALPFGTIRVRRQGSDGGNRGIKSMNTHVEQNYMRIRIGTRNELRERMDDSAFVLAKFSANESKQLEKNIIPKAVKLVEQFCTNTLEQTSYKTLE